MKDEIVFLKLCRLLEASHPLWYRLQWRSDEISIFVCVWCWGFFNTCYNGNKWYWVPEALLDRLITNRHLIQKFSASIRSHKATQPASKKCTQWQHMPQHLEITMHGNMHQTLFAKAETGSSLLFGPPATLLDYYPWNILNDYVEISSCLTKYTMQLTF